MIYSSQIPDLIPYNLILELILLSLQMILWISSSFFMTDYAFSFWRSHNPMLRSLKNIVPSSSCCAFGPTRVLSP